LSLNVNKYYFNRKAWMYNTIGSLWCVGTYSNLKYRRNISQIFFKRVWTSMLTIFVKITNIWKLFVVQNLEYVLFCYLSFNIRFFIYLSFSILKISKYLLKHGFFIDILRTKCHKQNIAILVVLCYSTNNKYYS